MIRSFRSEWRKLFRPGLIAGAGGAMAGFATLAAVLIFRRSTTPIGRGRIGTRLRISPVELAKADGLVRGFRASAQLVGIVTLVVFASSMLGRTRHRRRARVGNRRRGDRRRQLDRERFMAPWTLDRGACCRR